jgi:hypothetical protein|tara:strand:- start:594 stop:800 length:207 start_codon:yes stop_codon:yes gene_type:complete
MDWWDEYYDDWDYDKYTELLNENWTFHYFADLEEECEREEQIKKIFNKLISVDVEHISNHIFSFINYL